MDFRAAIIDLDGVMLDSLGVWSEIDTDFVRRYNLKNGPEIVERLKRTTSLLAAGHYLREECGHPNTPEEIAEEFVNLLGEHYKHTLQLFPGVLEKLAELKGAGIRLAMVTASPEIHARPAAERTGIIGFFDKIYYDESKTTPGIFLRAADELDATIETTLVIDDNPRLRAVAESAGFRTFPSLASI